ncbi:DUF1217 domain-containing protein [Mesorhizobium sp. SB112]|uniref:DUF1217 domain-containing protein n=1 Tax=Mesorhizobium sp. SB112 TaxID=3151853 RepID=UPI003266F80E
MINTYTSYQLIARDLSRSLNRVEKQPLVDRETKYYQENITKVTSIEEFVKNDRLFKYAMKAHGLEDMAYAKAFMVKAMKEGISDPESFANKLTDKRYADFVKSFNFEAHGANATVYNKAQHLTVTNFAVQTAIDGVDPAIVKAETDYYKANISDVKSIDDLLADERLYKYVLTAFAIGTAEVSKEFIGKVLEEGIRDPDSLANKNEDKRFAALASAFNFEEHGEATTTFSLAQRPAIDKFMRQTLEEDAGAQNEGVRLALYFQRKAPNIKSFYEVLADPALAKVVRTALGLPASFASADIDKQVQLFESRLKIEDFSDPQALGKFLTRFTSLWEIDNPSSTAQTSLSVLFSQPVELGISTNLMMALQKMRR